jgi:hypothetical protein
MKRIASILLALGLAVAPCAAAAADTPTPAPPKKGEKADEFTGYGAVPFHTTYDAFKTRYPSAEVVSEGQNLGAPSIGGPYIRRLLLKGQKVEGLEKPTMVELRFWKNKLWGVIVYYGENDPEKIHAMLTKRLGPSDSTDPTNPLWERSKTQTTAQTKQRWFGINDTVLSKEAQEWFKLALTGKWRGATAEELVELGLATPVATPASGKTPVATGAAVETPHAPGATGK